MSATTDYQQGFYDGVSKVREMLTDNYSVNDPFLRPIIENMLAHIDALLHAPPEI